MVQVGKSYQQTCPVTELKNGGGAVAERSKALLLGEVYPPLGISFFKWANAGFFFIFIFSSRKSKQSAEFELRLSGLKVRRLSTSR